MTQEQPVLQTCTNCATIVDVSDEEPFGAIHCPICGTAMRAKTQFNQYQLLEEIGSGGMGTVYRALDVHLQRRVALKLLRKEMSDDPEHVAKLEREAKIMASINHPHVV